MGSGPRQRLTVEARLLADPCLWCWEIRDAEGALVESSSALHWTAYPSREEALAAASRRASVERERVRLPRGGMTPGQGDAT